MTPQEIELIVQKYLDRSLKGDYIIFNKGSQFQDGKNVQFGKTTGTKIGTNSTEKIGFFGATPVVRQTANTAPSGGGSGSTDAIDISARTAIGQIRTTLNNLGLTA